MAFLDRRESTNTDLERKRLDLGTLEFFGAQ